MNLKLNNKGFAITSFLYSIFAVFLVILSLLILSMTNSKITLDKIKKDIKISLDDVSTNKSLYEKVFNYTGDSQIFTVPYSGWYLVELWGANVDSNNGAYNKGKIYLNENDIVYINIGQGGIASALAFNSGSTDIRYASSDANDRIMVALNNLSFVSGYAGVNATISSLDSTLTNNTIHYSGKYFIDVAITPNVNAENGKAKITYLSESRPLRKNDKLNGVRYIKDCIAGGSMGSGNVWNEIQAIKDGINVAKGKKAATPSDYDSTYYNPISITDGIITYPFTVGSGTKCVIVDLEDVYDLDEIAVWHFFNDGRTFYDNVTSVSNDNINWTTVINKTEPETSSGKRINAYN